MDVDQKRVNQVLSAIIQEVGRRPIPRRSRRLWLWAVLGAGFYLAGGAVMLSEVRMLAAIWTWLIAVLWPSLLLLLLSHPGVWLLLMVVLLGIGAGLRRSTRTGLRR